MTKQEAITVDILRKAFEPRGFPQKYYYPIHPKMWESFLRLGWTEEQLTAYGFLKSDYIEPLIGGK